MKKFLLLYYGYAEPTPEIRSAWQQWFAKVGDRVVDSGNPLGNCVEVAANRRRELSPDQGAATGYSIVSAESLADAERLLEGCPVVTSVRIYEAMAM
jgi:hypothetical protein